MKESISSVKSGKLFLRGGKRVLEFVELFLPEWLDHAANWYSKDIILKLVNDYNGLDDKIKEKGLSPFIYLCPKLEEGFEPINGFDESVDIFKNPKKTLNDLNLSDEREFEIVYAAIEEVFKNQTLRNEKRSLYHSSVKDSLPKPDVNVIYGCYVIEFDTDPRHTYFSISFATYVMPSSVK